MSQRKGCTTRLNRSFESPMRERMRVAGSKGERREYPQSDRQAQECSLEEALMRAACAEALVARKDAQIDRMIAELEEATANALMQQQAIQAEHEVKVCCMSRHNAIDIMI